MKDLSMIECYVLESIQNKCTNVSIKDITIETTIIEDITLRVNCIKRAIIKLLKKDLIIQTCNGNYNFN